MVSTLGLLIVLGAGFLLFDDHRRGSNSVLRKLVNKVNKETDKK
jgi:hypothetical protein